MLVKGEDGKMVECEIISTRDHESVFNKNAPILPLVFSVLCCILNIVPGKIFWEMKYIQSLSMIVLQVW